MKLILLPLFSILLLFTACDPANKPARGFEDEIFVIADSAEYEKFQTALESAFEKIIYTPQPEKLFNLKRVDLSNIERYKRMKNIVVAAPLNSESPASEFVKAVIDSSIEDKIMTDENLIIYSYDLWAKYQLVTVLSAPNIEELESKIFRNADNLLYSYQKVSDERLYRNLYRERYEQKDVQGSFLRDYGWMIYVQADYKVAFNQPEDKFVWLRRSPGSDMERWIFVHWIDDASPDYLVEDSIKVIRDRITKRFYRTSDDTSYVVVAENYFTTNEINFNERYTLLTQGLWELNVKGMGGPFVNYMFYDEETRRIYMLDGSVYAPKYYKRNLIQQMDVTLQSFRTKEELSDERIEELFDAVDD